MKHYIENSKDIYNEKFFISYNKKETSFNEFYYNVCSKSRALNSLNISTQDIVGIFLSNPIDTIEIYFSCLQLNKKPIILPSNISSFELQNIITRYKINLIISEWLCKNMIRTIKGASFFYIQELSSSYGGCAPMEFEKNIKNLEAIQSMHLTSGSTGVPKLIKLTFNNFINSVAQWDKEIKFLDTDRYIQCLPLNHIAGLSIIIRSQIKGFESILMKKFNASQINFEIDNGATLVSLIPSMLKKLLDNRLGRPFSNHFKGIILGGDGCSQKTMEQSIKYNVPIYKSYGMTETCSGIAGFWLNKFPDMLNSVGKSFKDTSIRISKSRIKVKGPTVSPYDDKGELSNHTILTSDLGFKKNNFLFITGRCDDIVISKGENISLSHIKNILFQHRDIVDVYLETQQDDHYGTKITAFVQVATDDLNEKNIYDYLSDYLSKSHSPAEIQIVDQINHD